MKPGDLKVCGVNAVNALFRHRPDDLLRVWVAEERVRDVGPILKWCAEHRRPYHVSPDSEIARVADTVHHEGVVALARQRPVLGLEDVVAAVRATSGPLRILLLENVRNPHNFGAILRVAAHFGVRFALVSRLPGKAGLPTAVYRTAEGGAEAVAVAAVGDPARALLALAREGLTVLGTSDRGTRSVFDAELPDRLVACFGAESEGLSANVLRVCTDVLAIPGTGEVESLNVATAAAVVLAEAWRSAGRQGRARD